MTLIAGIISRHNRPLPNSACISLAESLSRNPTDKVQTFSGHSNYFAKLDIGAFAEPGVHLDANGALSLLTGELLLGHGNSRVNRPQDLATLHEELLKNNWNALGEAQGTFSVVQFQPQSGELTLIADKLGIRPLYFWSDEDFFVFASALRVVEACPLVPKKMDLRAVTEMVGLGVPLADRTPYAGISRLRAAEIVQVSNAKTSRHCYWRWDEIEISRESEKSRLAIVYDSFQSAVDRRIGNDRATAAFLSGGLDSRCVVAALIHNGVCVHSVNFARPGTQDDYFGNEFAREIGAVHRSLPKDQGDSVPDYSLLMALALARNDSAQPSRYAAERPQVVWSGEGGSVLLGHVHVNQSIVELMRAGSVERAIDRYLEREQVHVPAKLLRKHVLADAREVIRQGIREELEQLNAPDAGRNFHLFLMLNEQRRKLSSHFENIDQHRLEFQLPFFHGQFVAEVIATPLDWCLRHEFYIKWLSHFPRAVATVGWQAYPGHQPCPLPAPLELGYQWDEQYQKSENAIQKLRVINQAEALLGDANFPHQLLSRRNLRLAAWIHARGWRDYRYAIAAAQTYHAYAKKCGGEFTFSLT